METLPEDNFTKDMHNGEQLYKTIPFLAATSIIGDKVHDEKEHIWVISRIS